MAAPVGNRFWQLRSKHGRDKLFSSPSDLWAAACEYFEWCEDNPLLSTEYVGKDAMCVEVPKMRPFTIQGICSYLDCNVEYFRNFKAQARIDKEDFSWVITRIEETIYNQKYTGAASGFLNANLIARDLGLTEKTDNSHKIKLGTDLEAEYE